LPFCDPPEWYKFPRGMFYTPCRSLCRIVVDKNLPYFRSSRPTCHTIKYLFTCFLLYYTSA
jgi:hypothetical protein